MKYCCEFTGDFPKLECYDEVIVKLFANDDITNIRQFFDKHPKQTIIIHLADNSKEYIDDKSIIEENKNKKYWRIYDCGRRLLRYDNNIEKGGSE